MATPLRTPQELRRRRALVGWIPTLIIVVVLAAVVSTALIVAGQGIGNPRTLPPAVGPNGYSTFDDAGQRYISDERTVWIDLRQTPIQASTLSLPDAGTLVIGPREGVSYYLGLYGNNTPVKAAVDSIDITTDAGILTAVTAHALRSGGFADVEVAIDRRDLTDSRMPMSPRSRMTLVCSTARADRIRARSPGKSWACRSRCKCGVGHRPSVRSTTS